MPILPGGGEVGGAGTCIADLEAQMRGLARTSKFITSCAPGKPLVPDAAVALVMLPLWQVIVAHRYAAVLANEVRDPPSGSFLTLNPPRLQETPYVSNATYTL